MKIGIRLEKEYIEGEVIDSRVKPFGTSAHIPISKKHIGKRVLVIIPDEKELVNEF